MFIKNVKYNYIFERESGVKIDSKKFPYNLDVFNFFKSGNELNFSKKVTFFVGDNGAGKTSFIEAFAYNLGLNKFGGSKNFILDKEDKPILSDFLSIGKNNTLSGDAFFFRAENFFNLQDDLDKYLDTGSYTGDKNSFREMSHGQGFKAFFENRLGDEGIYIFDEPESALSVESQIEFLFLLKELSLLNNQIFIVTHSPVILSFPNCEIYDVSDNFNKINYDETTQFCDMKQFIENVDRYRHDLERD